MNSRHKRLLFSLNCVGIGTCTAFIGNRQTFVIRPKTSELRPPVAPFLHSTSAHPFSRKSQLRFQPEVNDGKPTIIEINNGTSLESEEFSQLLRSNNLQTILSYLQSHPSSIPNLSKSQVRMLFDTIEMATTESEDNTVNKRALQDSTVMSAAGGGGVEFRSLDRVRSQMTQLYRLLRENGILSIFGAVGRPPPTYTSISSQPEGPIYPASGSKIITPTLLEKITNMEMISLTPRPTNLLLYVGIAVALSEGLASLYFDISFNLIVVCSILLVLMDQILVSGAVFETALRMIRPEMTSRITKHEAGHFLCAYLLGCPVEGVVLSKWAALNDGRFGRRSSVISAGTSYFDLDLSEQIAGVKPLTRESIDRYSVIVMGGIAAEALEFGRADGGAGDEEALVRFLSSLNPRSQNAVSAWTPELIRNQARWGATQAVLLLREYKSCYSALVDTLERGGDLGQCILAIEEAGTQAGLSWFSKPLGMVLDEGEYGKWIPVDDDNVVANNSNPSEPTHPTADSLNKSKNELLPISGDQSLVSTEEFLRNYRDILERKLESIDAKLEELEANDTTL